MQHLVPSHLVSASSTDGFTTVGQRADGTLTIFYPLSILCLVSSAIVLLLCFVGYCVNLTVGLRGTAAIPMYRYLSASLSYSEYQLKPAPNPHDM